MTTLSLTLSLDASDGGGLAWVYRHAEVLERRDRAGKIALYTQNSSTGRWPGSKTVFQEKSSFQSE